MRNVEYFSTVCQAFEKASELRGDIVDRFYGIGGYTVHLRFAGPALLPYVTPALDHLAVPSGPRPDLDIYLWDSLSTGLKLPTPPWQTEDLISRGEIRGFGDQRVRAVFQPNVNTVSMLDSALNKAIYWAPAAGGIPHYECSTPLRAIFHWWMSDRNLQLVHAAAVGTATGCALITGKGGSGKSSTALACLKSELLYLGDDHVLLGVEPTAKVFSVYNTAKLNPDNLQRFPHLIAETRNLDKLDTEKAVMYLRDRCLGNTTDGLPLRVILLPRVTGLPDTQLRQISRVESLRAMAPSTIFQLPGAGGQVLKTLGRLVEQVPSYVLEVGTDVQQIPQVIAELLADAE